jgi:ribonuclease D
VKIETIAKNDSIRMTNLKITITEEEVQSLPLISFEKEIVVVENEEEVNEAFNYLRFQKHLGFDTETKPAFKKGQKHEVALLQLATEEKAFLFRLNKLTLNGQIRKILSDKNIIKIGVAIKDDLIALKKKNAFVPQSFVELQELVKKFGIQNFSLQKLSAIVLGVRISKSKRLSNWESEKLNEAQQKYAATDAWMALEVYKTLLEIE